MIDRILITLVDHPVRDVRINALTKLSKKVLTSGKVVPSDIEKVLINRLEAEKDDTEYKIAILRVIW